MKKNVVSIAIVMLLILSMTVSFAACKKTPKGKETTTAEEPISEVVTVETSAETTGESSTTKTSGETSAIENATELSVEEVEKDAPVSAKGKAGSLDDKTINNMSDYKPKEPAGSNVRLKDSYKELFKSKKLLMKLKIGDTGESDLDGTTILVAYNGSSSYVQYEFMGMSLAILSKENKTYMICPDNKTYTRYADGEEGLDMGVKDVVDEIGTIVDDDNSLYLKTETVKVNGKDLTCESYKSDEVVQKYYFDGTKLTKIETVDSSGAVAMSTTIEKLTNDFDDSLFNIPKGYTPLTSTAFATAMISKYSKIFEGLV